MSDYVAVRLGEIAERGQALAAELDAIHERQADEETPDEVTTADNERLVALGEEAAALKAERAELEAKVEARNAVRELAKNPVNVVPSEAPMVNRLENDPYEGFDVRNQTDMRSRAMDAVERVADWEITDKNKERIGSLLARDKGAVSRLVLATGSDAYKRAFTKALTQQLHLLTSEEQAALQRAASLTDGAGGFAVPFPIDPTLIITGDGTTNPVRALARVETITTDSWQGISAGPAVPSWDGEAAEVSDDTPTWTQPSVSVHKAQVGLPFSIEIGMDYPNFAGDVAAVMGRGKDDLEAAAFVTGTGSSQPTGIVTAIDGTGNDVSSAGADTFAIADVYSLYETVGPRFRSRASWLANVAILSEIRQFGTADGHMFSGHLPEAIPTNILGRPAFEASEMDGTYGSGENNVLVFGDFENYVIADRVGFTVELVPHLLATANNLPNGQRAFYGYWRTGGDSVLDDAFALLNVT